MAGRAARVAPVSAITGANGRTRDLDRAQPVPHGPAYKRGVVRHGSMRRLLALSLLLLALAVVATPAVFALMVLLRGDVGGALAVFGPVLLIPLGFAVVGVYFSLKRSADAGDDRAEDA